MPTPTRFLRPVLRKLSATADDLEELLASLSAFYQFGVTDSRFVSQDTSKMNERLQGYLSNISIMLSALMASSGAALAFPGINGKQLSLAVNAYYTSSFGLSVLGLMLVLYLTVATRLVDPEHSRPRSHRSVPFATPCLVAVSSALLLLVGVVLMVYDTWNPNPTDTNRSAWCHLLVLLPLGGTFLLGTGIVISSELVIRGNRRGYASSPRIPPEPIALLHIAILATNGSTVTAADRSRSGDTSVNALHQVLATSGLPPAATIERIVNLVSARPRVSSLEFFGAYPPYDHLISEVTTEQVAQAIQQGALLSPALGLTHFTILTTSAPGYTYPSPPPVSAPSYRADDPWVVRRVTLDPFVPSSGFSTSIGGAPASGFGTGGIPASEFGGSDAPGNAPGTRTSILVVRVST